MAGSPSSGSAALIDGIPLRLRACPVTTPELLPGSTLLSTLLSVAGVVHRLYAGYSRIKTATFLNKDAIFSWRTVTDQVQCAGQQPQSLTN